MTAYLVAVVIWLVALFMCFRNVELDRMRKTLRESGKSSRTDEQLVLGLTPEYRYIWMTGFVPVHKEEQVASWVNSLPNFACKRYSGAKVFVIKQDRRAVSAGNVGKAPLKIQRSLFQFTLYFTLFFLPDQSKSVLTQM